MSQGRPKTILGLTGSIGMGKSTTAEFFRKFGVPVYDSDAAVHRLYDAEGAAAGLIGKLFPATVMANGAVDRTQLRREVLKDQGALQTIEKIVHPLIDQQIYNFLKNYSNTVLVVLDIPLLFETKAEELCDAVLVVTAPADIQRNRVLARPGMTTASFEAISSKQIPDTQKRARADFIIDTSSGFEHGEAAVAALVAKLSDPG